MGMEFEPKRNDDQSNWDNTRIGLDGIPGEEGVIYWKKQNGTREVSGMEESLLTKSEGVNALDCSGEGLNGVQVV